MFILLSTLWFVWEIKCVLFWLYLWQLKDYHVGRFFDHFRTHKGRKLIFSFTLISKLVLFILFLFWGGLFIYLFSILLLLYLGELVLFLRSIFNKSIKKPTKSLKILFLSVVSFLTVVLFMAWTLLKLKDSLQPASFLAFDILTPLIISAVVLLFQPFFVAIRNNILRRAKEKINKIKSVSGLNVIAITGSYGKTSTKEFLSTILSKKYKILKTKENQNSEIGIANCILQDLKISHQIFIAEIGAYNKGKVREVCSMLMPKIGVVTGVNEQHLALFGSLQNLLSAEGGGELEESLPRDNQDILTGLGPKDGLLVVNGDNKYCLALYKKSDKNKKIYSLNNKIIDSDIWSDSVTIHKDHISFLATNKEGDLAHFNVGVLGKQNVQNILGAILIAKELGMSFGEISDACKNIFQEQAGMVLKNGKHSISVIDSSYSANPDGVYADLDYLSVFSQKKVIVMPCLIELGNKSAEIHEKIGQKIGEICDLAIITTKDKFKEIEKGFNKARNEKKPSFTEDSGKRSIIFCDKPQDIYSIITLFCESNDAVLLEGRVPGKLVSLLAD